MQQDRKAALRSATLAARRALSPRARTRAARALQEQLLALPELTSRHTVVLYAALADEIDVLGTVAELQARRAVTAFPRVRGERLELVATQDPTTLQPGYGGIREPLGPAIDPSDVEAIVVPGVAFDPQGGRLGHGAGFYDRLLATLPERTVRIGVCFACQMVPAVPRLEHDMGMDVVVTDRAVYRTEARLPRPTPECS